MLLKNIFYTTPTCPNIERVNLKLQNTNIYITRVRSHNQAKLFLFGSVANSEEKKKNVLNVDSEYTSAQRCSVESL